MRQNTKTIAGLALAAVFCAPLAPAGLIRFAPDAAIPVSQLPLQQVPKRPEVCKVGAADMPWFKERLQRETDPRWVEYAERVIDRAIAFQRMVLSVHLREQTLRPDVVARNGGNIEKHPQLLSWHGESIEDWEFFQRNVQDAGKWAWMMRMGIADESSVDCALRFDKDADYHYGVENGLLAGLTMVAGFYDATQSAGGAVYYASVTDGNSGNTGASSTPGATGPKATWAQAEALRRDGYDDWVLLDARDTFTDYRAYGTTHTAVAGASSTERQLLGSYGIGSGARATITPTDTTKAPLQLKGPASSNWIVQNVILDSGLSAGGGDPAVGIYIMNAIENVTLDCVRVHKFSNGVTVSSDNATAPVAIEMNRCVVHNCFADSGVGVGGVQFYGTIGNIQRDCVWDRNGQDGYGPNIFTHNDYNHGNNTGSQAIRVVSGRASSKGIGRRAGGVSHNNLSIECPVANEFGGVTGVVTGDVTYSVIYGQVDTYAYILNATTDTDFGYNLAYRSSAAPSWLIVTGAATNTIADQTNLAIHDCVAHDWYNSYNAYQGGIRVDAGQNNTTITDCIFYQPVSGSAVSCTGSGGSGDGADECDWSGCRMYTQNGPSNLIDVGFSSSGFETFVAGGGGSVTGGVYTAPTFSNADYDIDEYGTDNSVVGMTTASFLTAACANRRNSWNVIYTARQFNDASRAAHDMPEIGTVDPPTLFNMDDGPTSIPWTLTPNALATSHKIYLATTPGGPYTLFKTISGAPTSGTLEAN